MTKKYNILKDEKFIKHILAELCYYCQSHKNCTYCNFHYEDSQGDNRCRLECNQCNPEKFIDYIGDED